MTFTKNNQLTNTLYTHEAIAQQLSWQPIQKNGKPLTHMILESIEGTLEFHLTILSRLFYFSFILFGFAFIFYATFELLSYHFQATLWSIVLGFTLIGVGVYMFSKQAVPHIFDKEKNLYFKENEKLEREDEIPLDKIHALQVILYNEKSEKQAELNLVLKNGKRVYVCSYDSDEYERVEKDVEKISKYINKPIWNGEMV
jgi:cbb3-type cytochrome oxidase subunit 3